MSTSAYYQSYLPTEGGVLESAPMPTVSPTAANPSDSRPRVS